MKKGWTTTKLIAIGALAVMQFITRLTIYITLLTFTGSIFAGTTILIISPFFSILTALIIGQFGTVTIFSFLNFLFGLPTPTIFPQIVNLFEMPLKGLFVDSIFLKLQERPKISSFVGGAIANLVDVVVVITLFFSIGIFGSQNVPGFLITPLGLITVGVTLSLVGGLSGLLAFYVYQKIKNTNVVKRIQA